MLTKETREKYIAFIVHFTKPEVKEGMADALKHFDDTQLTTVFNLYFKKTEGLLDEYNKRNLE